MAMVSAAQQLEQKRARVAEIESQLSKLPGYIGKGPAAAELNKTKATLSLEHQSLMNEIEAAQNKELMETYGLKTEREVQVLRRLEPQGYKYGTPEYQTEARKLEPSAQQIKVFTRTGFRYETVYSDPLSPTYNASQARIEASAREQEREKVARLSGGKYTTYAEYSGSPEEKARLGTPAGVKDVTAFQKSLSAYGSDILTGARANEPISIGKAQYVYPEIPAAGVTVTTYGTKVKEDIPIEQQARGQVTTPEELKTSENPAVQALAKTDTAVISTKSEVLHVPYSDVRPYIENLKTGEFVSAPNVEKVKEAEILKTAPPIEPGQFLITTGKGAELGYSVVEKGEVIPPVESMKLNAELPSGVKVNLKQYEGSIESYNALALQDRVGKEAIVKSYGLVSREVEPSIFRTKLYPESVANKLQERDILKIVATVPLPLKAQAFEYLKEGKTFSISTQQTAKGPIYSIFNTEELKAFNKKQYGEIKSFLETSGLSPVERKTALSNILQGKEIRIADFGAGSKLYTESEYRAEIARIGKERFEYRKSLEVSGIGVGITKLATTGIPEIDNLLIGGGAFVSELEPIATVPIASLPVAVSASVATGLITLGDITHPTEGKLFEGTLKFDSRPREAYTKATEGVSRKTAEVIKYIPQTSLADILNYKPPKVIPTLTTAALIPKEGIEGRAIRNVQGFYTEHPAAIVGGLVGEAVLVALPVKGVGKIIPIKYREVPLPASVTETTTGIPHVVEVLKPAYKGLTFEVGKYSFPVIGKAYQYTTAAKVGSKLVLGTEQAIRNIQVKGLDLASLKGGETFVTTELSRKILAREEVFEQLKIPKSDIEVIQTGRTILEKAAGTPAKAFVEAKKPAELSKDIQFEGLTKLETETVFTFAERVKGKIQPTAGSVAIHLQVPKEFRGLSGDIDFHPTNIKEIRTLAQDLAKSLNEAQGKQLSQGRSFIAEGGETVAGKVQTAKVYLVTPKGKSKVAEFLSPEDVEPNAYGNIKPTTVLGYLTQSKAIEIAGLYFDPRKVLLRRSIRTTTGLQKTETGFAIAAEYSEQGPKRLKDYARAYIQGKAEVGILKGSKLPTRRKRGAELDVAVERYLTLAKTKFPTFDFEKYIGGGVPAELTFVVSRVEPKPSIITQTIPSRITQHLLYGGVKVAPSKVVTQYTIPKETTSVEGRYTAPSQQATKQYSQSTYSKSLVDTSSATRSRVVDSLRSTQPRISKSISIVSRRSQQSTTRSTRPTSQRSIASQPSNLSKSMLASLPYGALLSRSIGSQPSKSKSQISRPSVISKPSAVSRTSRSTISKGQSLRSLQSTPYKSTIYNRAKSTSSRYSKPFYESQRSPPNKPIIYGGLREEGYGIRRPTRVKQGAVSLVKLNIPANVFGFKLGKKGKKYKSIL